MFIKEQVLFHFNYDNVNNEAFVINLLILVKFHIHKCKFSNKKPFKKFYKELENYFCTIQHSTNRQAIKTVHLCSISKSLSDVKVLHVCDCTFFFSPSSSSYIFFLLSIVPLAS